MEYTGANLPVHLKHGDVLPLGDGTTVSFDTNAEDKNVSMSGDFTPICQLFPGMEHEFTTAKGNYRLTAFFGDDLVVEKTAEDHSNGHSPHH